jgi:hypothetical protein
LDRGVRVRHWHDLLRGELTDTVDGQVVERFQRMGIAGKLPEGFLDRRDLSGDPLRNVDKKECRRTLLKWSAHVDIALTNLFTVVEDFEGFAGEVDSIAYFVEAVKVQLKSRQLPDVDLGVAFGDDYLAGSSLFLSVGRGTGNNQETDAQSKGKKP